MDVDRRCWRAEGVGVKEARAIFGMGFRVDSDTTYLICSPIQSLSCIFKKLGTGISLRFFLASHIPVRSLQ